MICSDVVWCFLGWLFGWLLLLLFISHPFYNRVRERAIGKISSKEVDIDKSAVLLLYIIDNIQKIYYKNVKKSINTISRV